MRRKKSSVEQVILAEPTPEQPVAIAPVPDWRFSPTPPSINPESGERITGVAEDWRRDDPSLPWLLIRCDYGCRDLIATRSLKRDVCESCAYRIRDEFYERRQADIRRATDQLVNPFLSRDPFKEVGSLPSLSGPSKRR